MLQYEKPIIEMIAFRLEDVLRVSYIGEPGVSEEDDLDEGSRIGDGTPGTGGLFSILDFLTK